MVSPELLRRYPFFAGLTDDELAAVAMIAEESALPAGAVIFREGDPARFIYVLTAGTVELVYEIHRPARTDVSYVGSIAAGEAFGISSFVEPHRMTATARAESPVRLITVDATALRMLSESNCHLGYTIACHIAQALAERLTFARVQLAALS